VFDGNADDLLSLFLRTRHLEVRKLWCNGGTHWPVVGMVCFIVASVACDAVFLSCLAGDLSLDVVFKVRVSIGLVLREIVVRHGSNLTK
jgi:hypothetical protein